MRRAVLACAGVLLVGALGAAADPAKPSEDASAQIAAAWQQRLADAQAKLVMARERAETSQRAVTRARHSNHPRGEALNALVGEAADARKALDAAEAELPELLEQARLAGVEPGVLRPFESDESD